MPVVLEEFRRKRILVVEDEYTLAQETRLQLEASHAIVIGPVPSVGQALALIDEHEVDAAILDVMLDAETSLPIAEALEFKRIPVVFATAVSLDYLPERYRGFVVSKPSGMQEIAQRLFGDRPH